MLVTVTGYTFSPRAIKFLETFGRLYGAINFGTPILTVLACIYFYKDFLSFNAQVKTEENWRRLRPAEVATLCIWFGPDEAYWMLYFLRSAGEAIHALTQNLARFGMVPVTIAISGAAGWYSWTAKSAWPLNIPPFQGILTTMELQFGFGLALAITPFFLWSVAVIMSSPLVFGIGTDGISDHLWLSIRTERIPQIADEFVERCELPILEGRMLSNVLAALPIFSGPMVHSRAYIDQRTPVAIASWYKARRSKAGKSINSHYEISWEKYIQHDCIMAPVVATTVQHLRITTQASMHLHAGDLTSLSAPSVNYGPVAWG
jgi:hypothetical protein